MTSVSTATAVNSVTSYSFMLIINSFSISFIYPNYRCFRLYTRHWEHRDRQTLVFLGHFFYQLHYIVRVSKSIPDDLKFPVADQLGWEHPPQLHTESSPCHTLICSLTPISTAVGERWKACLKGQEVNTPLANRSLSHLKLEKKYSIRLKARTASLNWQIAFTACLPGLESWRFWSNYL